MKTHVELARGIVEYLSAHPGAEDSREEITAWLLGQDKGRVRPDDIEHALNLLIEKGEIEVATAKQDVVIYRMNPLPGLKSGVSGLLHLWPRPMASPHDARMASASLRAAIHPQA